METEKIYKVANDECISCHACVEVAGNNFKMGSDEIAFVIKQPENDVEIEQCEEALEICPVGAILSKDIVAEQIGREPVIATSNIKKTIDQYPFLKEVLVEFSNKFNKLLNPIIYNKLARFATFNDASRVTDISVCEILHVINKALGTMDELQKIAPDCVKYDESENIFDFSQPITWDETDERYIYNIDTLGELTEKISKLPPQGNIVIISVNNPLELVIIAKGLDFFVNVEKNREYRISIINPKSETKVPESDWKERKDKFDKLDVRDMQTDPFDIIFKKAYNIPENQGFILIQRFEPFPLINMLSEMGFEYLTEYKSVNEVWVYFYKTPREGKIEGHTKAEIVIQSATPVAYPVIMRLLQSDAIRKNVVINELRVWEETEKHLAWIVNGKADISFSAVITSVKLKDADIKIPAIFVWDNFVILTRYQANDLIDIRGKKIHTPLFEEAPPAKITKYLIKASGLNPDDFEFIYGKPFGRPEEIYADFVSGVADTVILREPEASYAIKIMQDRGENISIISYNELWNKINPGFGSFPNAGIVFKGETYRNNPELSALFLEELKNAIDWVNNHQQKAAQLSFDMMRQPTDRIELFLNRVNFKYVSGEELMKKVKSYFDILVNEGMIETEISESFYDIFRT